MPSSTSTFSLREMSAGTKVAAVLGGYAVAFACGYLAMLSEIHRHDAMIPPASQGMAAFSESVVFLCVFAAVSIFPTGAALYFLRPVPRFWSAASWAALLFAITNLWAIGVWVLESSLGPWGAVAFMRVLFVSPFSGAGFAISGVFAPEWRWRKRLFLAAAIEA